jgi:hypothetical protein
MTSNMNLRFYTERPVILCHYFKILFLRSFSVKMSYDYADMGIRNIALLENYLFIYLLIYLVTGKNERTILFRAHFMLPS